MEKAVFMDLIEFMQFLNSEESSGFEFMKDNFISRPNKNMLSWCW